MPARRKHPREKNRTDAYLSGQVDEDQVPTSQRFSHRSAGAQQQKMEKTALLRAAEEEITGNIEALPMGEVIQVFSLFIDVQHEGEVYLCVVRKTLTKVSQTSIVVGDLVRIRDTGMRDESGKREAVIEQISPRRSVLTRADSFKAVEAQPIVANADQMLIVATLREPDIKWGLIDRMLVAAMSGALAPILCINKSDVYTDEDRTKGEEFLTHYESLGIKVVRTSAKTGLGLDEIKDLLKNKTTVLAGHSGVGKSSLIHAIQPALDLRVAALSGYTGKGRHTTSSARRYLLEIGGYVIDTPGVKLFGLWGVTRENLPNFFSDIKESSAPEWRQESYQRILESLPVQQSWETEAAQNQRDVQA